MPAHTTQVALEITKTALGFTIGDTTSYPTGSDNHKREEWAFWLIVVDDPRGYRYLLSSHDFLSDTFNLIQSPGTVSTPPLSVLKSDSGVGRYTVGVYGLPEFDDDGSIEDNYGAGDAFAVLNSDGTISMYSVVTDVVPTTDTDLTDATKYTPLTGITSVPDRYKDEESKFLVMEEWLECFREKLETAYCKIAAEPANQSKLCTDSDVELIANLMPIKRTVLLIEAGTIGMSETNEKRITNLANSACCCTVNATENAASSNATDSEGDAGSSGLPEPCGIGYWIIEDDFVVQ